MGRRAYHQHGVNWRTITVDVEDLIHSSVEAIIIISNHPQLLDMPGQNQKGKNECFIINTSETLVARGYHFTHAKSWVGEFRMRSTSSKDLRLQPGKCTFVNYDFQGTVLFMAFEHVSGAQDGDITVCIDLCSGHTGVLDVPLRRIDNSCSFRYCWLGTQGPSLSIYKQSRSHTVRRTDTYSSDRFNITAKLRKEAVVHNWRIWEINIEFHGDRGMGNP
jgi:hypothetical protein